MDATISRIAKVSKRFYIDKDGCWRWTGTKSIDGYGRLLHRKGEKDSLINAHRWLYQLAKGVKLNSDQYCDHLCRNRACVNPEHIEVVDNITNILRGEGPIAKNARKTTCSRGHQFDAGNTRYGVQRNGNIRRWCKICLVSKRNERSKLKALNAGKLLS